MEKIEYTLTFADNGVVITPEDAACSVYEEEDKGNNPKACKAIGEEIYSYLLEDMINGPHYRYKVTINIKPLKG